MVRISSFQENVKTKVYALEDSLGVLKTLYGNSIGLKRVNNVKSKKTRIRRLASAFSGRIYVIN